MKYGSVCSGIEAASTAWHQLGWEPQFFSEIEPFPCSVLAHRYPHVPNYGDMTKFKEWPDATIDVLVGGTPCQSYSVAGLRAGLDDPRGNLMLTYVAIARRYRPRFVVWENVPGVLSSNKGRDFGSLLGLLTGQHIECPPTGWQNSGVVPGYKGAYGIAWRVLDAQYVRVESHPRAVPQRRRRVFLVGYLGDWRRAAAVLFERESMSGHPAPSRGKGKGFTGFTPGSFGGYGEGCGTLRKEGGDLGGGSETLVCCVHGTQDPIIADNYAHPLERMNGAYNNVLCMATGQAGAEIGIGIGTTLNCNHEAPIITEPFTLAIRGRGDGHNLEYRQDGTANAILTPNGGRGGIGVGAVAAFIPHHAEHEGRGGSFKEASVNHTLRGPNGTDNTLVVSGNAVAFAENSRAEVRLEGGDGSVCGAISTGGGKPGQGTPMVLQPQMRVRRLTPTECARLQGFPDNYLDVPHNGKPAADGPKYKGLGNSMATNCMEWIGRRIAMVDAL